MHRVLYSTLALFLCLSSRASWAQTAAPQGGGLPAAPSPVARRPFQLAYLRLGVGTSQELYKYYRCARLSVEYAPLLSRRLGLAGRLVGVTGKPTSELEKQLPQQNYQAAYLEQEVLFYPLGREKRVRFALGAGGFAGYYKRNSFDHFSAVSGQVTDYKLVSEQGVHAGYLGSLSVEAGLGTQQRWQVGLKSTLQNGLKGVSPLRTHSLTLARRL